jgi:hypothetical protein
MKFNFGTGLFVGAALFMLFVVVLVVKISQTNVPLVEENYYEKGIKYQQTIDNSEAADKLVNIQLITNNNNEPVVAINKNSNNDTLWAKVLFYRPSDPTIDFSIDIILIDTMIYPINANRLDKGKWKVKLSWEMNNRLYNKEQEIIL